MTAGYSGGDVKQAAGDSFLMHYLRVFCINVVVKTKGRADWQNTVCVCRNYSFFSAHREMNCILESQIQIYAALHLTFPPPRHHTHTHTKSLQVLANSWLASSNKILTVSKFGQLLKVPYEGILICTNMSRHVLR